MGPRRPGVLLACLLAALRARAGVIESVPLEPLPVSPAPVVAQLRADLVSLGAPVSLALPPAAALTPADWSNLQQVLLAAPAETAPAAAPNAVAADLPSPARPAAETGAVARLRVAREILGRYDPAEFDKLPAAGKDAAMAELWDGWKARGLVDGGEAPETARGLEAVEGRVGAPFLVGMRTEHLQPGLRVGIPARKVDALQERLGGQGCASSCARFSMAYGASLKTGAAPATLLARVEENTRAVLEQALRVSVNRLPPADRPAFLRRWKMTAPEARAFLAGGRLDPTLARLKGLSPEAMGLVARRSGFDLAPLAAAGEDPTNKILAALIRSEPVLAVIGRGADDHAVVLVAVTRTSPRYVELYDPDAGIVVKPLGGLKLVAAFLIGAGR